MGNKNLHKAKEAKKDEFYTRLSDIEKELQYYWGYFRGKTIFLNCDDPEKSNFWFYFSMKFKELGLKRLIATHYEKDKPSYMLEMVEQGKTIKSPLSQNGDFRSPESIELLKQSDIVVTNPPFSLFREFLSLLFQYNKKFLIIGNMNAITYKETFKLIKGGDSWLGINSPKEFVQPDGSVKKFGNICWFTNLEHKRRNEPLFLYKQYNDKEYPKYDNYDAIEVSKTTDIPMDYDGVMGVPISFLTKYNPSQFEIVGIDREMMEKDHGYVSRFFIRGSEVYARILIKHKSTPK